MGKKNKIKIEIPDIYEVQIANRQRKVPVDCARLKKVTAFVLQQMALKEAEISIVLFSDRGIQQLNKRYLGLNKPTDVLSFSQREGDDRGIYSVCLGDVIISTEAAARQATEAGLSFNQELDFLLVHGILHLLGYDHIQSPQEAAKMEKMQKQLIGRIKKQFP